jgi:pyridoxal phosphate enzyme (YggS family)
MVSIASRIRHLQQTLQRAETQHQRAPGSVQILAVSKGQPQSKILEAIHAGLLNFGENYYQEALPKIEALASYPLGWHFIGPIQRNKIKGIARHFSWVHSLGRLDVAEQLNQARPSTLPPLNVCIQLNLENEPTKSGVQAHEIIPLARTLLTLPNLCLRGLMVIPKPSEDPNHRYQQFQQVSQMKSLLSEVLQRPLDTLSMGMSDDFVEAIRAGSTCIRIGQALFGRRE